MYSAEDLYTEDVGGDLERIIEGNEGENIEQGNEFSEAVENPTADDDNENQTGDGDANKKDKPKRIIRNPQPKLNVETLKKPRGLLCLEKLFERVQFKGRGYEDQDLNVLMKTYEYWCHRLYPKFPFDDCIAKIEKLGSKKEVQTYLKRIRLGMLTDSDEIPEHMRLNESEEDEPNQLNQVEDHFDSLQTGSTQPRERSISPVMELTEEQLKRIQENKEKAERIRMERLRKIQEKAASVMEKSQNSMNGFDSQCENTASQQSLLGSQSEVLVGQRNVTLETGECDDEDELNEDPYEAYDDDVLSENQNFGENFNCENLISQSSSVDMEVVGDNTKLDSKENTAESCHETESYQEKDNHMEIDLEETESIENSQNQQENNFTHEAVTREFRENTQNEVNSKTTEDLSDQDEEL